MRLMFMNSASPSKQLIRFGMTFPIGTPALRAAMNLQLGAVPFANYLYTAYAHSTSPFNDIQSGSNDNLTKSTGVWSSGKGFDFVTGLGSMNGTKLAAALASAGLKPLAVESVPLSVSPIVDQPPRPVAGQKKSKKKDKTSSVMAWSSICL